MPSKKQTLNLSQVEVERGRGISVERGIWVERGRGIWVERGRDGWVEVENSQVEVEL